MTRCADHHTPTHPGDPDRSRRHCSGCDRTLPYWHELEPLATVSQGQWWDLKVDTGDARLWQSRCGLDDGEPYEHTVYVELLDESGRWVDVGHYDGHNPPTGLPGITPHMLKGELVK